MLIHLLRHAEAEDVSPSGRDGDRRLTEAGRKRMKAVAKAIARMDPDYDAVLVSPLVRSHETAEPVVEACGFDGDIAETRSLLPNADPRRCCASCRTSAPERVLLVGHQPHFGRLLGRLVAGRRDVEVPMKKAGLAEVETEGDPALGRAELKAYLPPRLLEELGGRRASGRFTAS